MASASYLKYKITSLFRIHLEAKKNEKLLRELYKGKCWNFLSALHDSKFKSYPVFMFNARLPEQPHLNNETEMFSYFRKYEVKTQPGSKIGQRTATLVIHVC